MISARLVSLSACFMQYWERSAVITVIRTLPVLVKQTGGVLRLWIHSVTCEELAHGALASCLAYLPKVLEQLTGLILRLQDSTGWASCGNAHPVGQWYKAALRQWMNAGHARNSMPLLQCYVVLHVISAGAKA
jgi:hypothetical protein